MNQPYSYLFNRLYFHYYTLFQIQLIIDYLPKGFHRIVLCYVYYTAGLELRMTSGFPLFFRRQVGRRLFFLECVPHRFAKSTQNIQNKLFCFQTIALM